MRKQFILALVAILVIGMVTMPVSAAEGGAAALTSGKGNPGELVELTLSLENFGMANAIGVTVTAPEGLEFVPEHSAWLPEGELSDISGDQAAWTTTDAVDVDIDVLTLAFRIPEIAQPGDSFHVECTVIVKLNQEELGTAGAEGEITLRTPAESLSLNKETLELDLADNAEEQLILMVSPAEAEAVPVWTSEDSAVAEVSEGLVTGKTVGSTVVTATLDDLNVSCQVNVTCSHGYEDDSDPDCDYCGEEREVEVVIETVSMFRLYNPNSGEHFYTGSVEERETLVGYGWHYEGVAWNAPVRAEAWQNVFRLFNPNSGDHHYTMSTEERDFLVSLGWIYEGVAWNTATTEGNVPQYRLYNPNADCGSHHYTGSEEERDFLVSLGWHYEGIGWYGIP